MSFEGIIHAQRMHTGDFFGGSDSDHDAFDARVAAEVEETLERMDTSLAGRNELQEAVERSDAADVQALAQDQEMEATEALLPPAFKKRRTKKGAAESGPGILEIYVESGGTGLSRFQRLPAAGQLCHFEILYDRNYGLSRICSPKP